MHQTKVKQARMHIPRHLMASFAIFFSVGASILSTAGCKPHAVAQQQPRGQIELGRQLFNDPGLSRTGRVSCADCHRPELAFSDARPVSIGVDGRPGTRNAPSLLDVGTVAAFFWDGREQDLRKAAVQALTNPVEMGQPDWQPVLRHIQQDARYRDLLSTGQSQASAQAEITDALAAYLETLVSAPSRYDRFMASGDPALLTQGERAGLTLFQGRAGCTDCHALGHDTKARFTDQGYHDAGAGLDQVSGHATEKLQALNALGATMKPLGEQILTHPDIAALGRFAVTRAPPDLGTFRTPSLRNVARTAPYMHDGSVASLEQAVDREIYYRGLSLERPLNLTALEQRQIVAFLAALSSNEKATPPQVSPVDAPVK